MSSAAENYFGPEHKGTTLALMGMMHFDEVRLHLLARAFILLLKVFSRPGVGYVLLQSLNLYMPHVVVVQFVQFGIETTYDL